MLTATIETAYHRGRADQARECAREAREAAVGLVVGPGPAGVPERLARHLQIVGETDA